MLPVRRSARDWSVRGVAGARGAGSGAAGGGACVRNPLPTCSPSVPFLQDGLAF